MDELYASKFFLGIIFILILALCIFHFKKKSYISAKKRYNAKKRELEKIIGEAEEMIDELNRLSDYIVSQVDGKSRELNENLERAEEKIAAMSEKLKLASGAAERAALQAGCQGVAEDAEVYAAGKGAGTQRDDAQRSEESSEAEAYGQEALRPLKGAAAVRSAAEKETAATAADAGDDDLTVAAVNYARFNGIAAYSAAKYEGLSRQARDDTPDEPAYSAASSEPAEIFFSALSAEGAETEASEAGGAEAVSPTLYTESVSPLLSEISIEPESSVSPVMPVMEDNRDIPGNKKHREVLRLSNEGMDSLGIAKRLNMGKGEVDLILELKR